MTTEADFGDFLHGTPMSNNIARETQCEGSGQEDPLPTSLASLPLSDSSQNPLRLPQADPNDCVPMYTDLEPENFSSYINMDMDTTFDDILQSSTRSHYTSGNTNREASERVPSVQDLATLNVNILHDLKALHHGNPLLNAADPPTISAPRDQLDRLEVPGDMIEKALQHTEHLLNLLEELSKLNEARKEANERSSNCGNLFLPSLLMSFIAVVRLHMGLYAHLGTLLDRSPGEAMPLTSFALPSLHLGKFQLAAGSNVQMEALMQLSLQMLTQIEDHMRSLYASEDAVQAIKTDKPSVKSTSIMCSLLDEFLTREGFRKSIHDPETSNPLKHEMTRVRTLLLSRQPSSSS
ncbi:MAG: hypothetical protein Q9162_000530 [Coniocarpon cinnabarinum]